MKLIITADWHLRSDLPACRDDPDWIKTQEEVIEFIFQFAKSKQAKLCIIGDLFHRGRDLSEVAYLFINKVLDYYGKVPVYLLGGNHDFLFHNVKNMNKSLFGLVWELERTGIIKPLWELGKASHFGEEIKGEGNLLFLHKFVYLAEDKLGKYINNSVSVDNLLKEYPEAKFIFTGDNHHKFVYKKDNRYVINPGCITVQNVGFKNYEPVVYFVNTETEEIKEILLPNKIEYLLTEANEESKIRDERIQMFVDSLRKNKEMSFDFEANVKEALKKDITDKELRDLILYYLEGV